MVASVTSDQVKDGLLSWRFEAQHCWAREWNRSATGLQQMFGRRWRENLDIGGKSCIHTLSLNLSHKIFSWWQVLFSLRLSNIFAFCNYLSVFPHHWWSHDELTKPWRYYYHSRTKYLNTVSKTKTFRALWKVELLPQVAVTSLSTDLLLLKY